MITYVSGSIFLSPAQVLVNTVNTEGVMGKGIALKFKQIYPQMFEQYQALCEQGKIRVGVLWLYKTPHKWILNFPTKSTWRQPSRIDYIESGLKKFRSDFTELNIPSIAFPALGCGNGELGWDAVRPVMEHYLKDLPAQVFIHPPYAQNELPEHHNQSEIREWLRAEPKTLPFSEVWADLKRVLLRRSAFATSSQPFEAKIVEDLMEKTLMIYTKTRPVRFDYEELREVWTHFRTIGYLRRGLVTSDIEKKLYYLMPILSELSYVTEARLYDSDKSRDYLGLQYIASAETITQPNLFG